MPVAKVAILGGGCGALAAAYALTSDPSRDIKVTVYQLGWRLGGKGASGRNMDVGRGARIEEHGLHVWGGFYHNAFRLIRDCYDKLARPAGAPFSTWDKVFTPVNNACLEEFVEGSWRHWPLIFPKTPGQPGDDSEIPTIWEVVEELTTWLHQTVAVNAPRVAEGQFASSLVSLFETMSSDPQHGTRAQHGELKEHISGLREAFIADLRVRDPGNDLRRLCILFDIAATCVIGILRDNVILNGFDSLDQWELKDWLRANGADETSIDSAIVTSGYDYVFGFKDGDINSPQLAAGVALRAFFRLLFDYQGAFFWKMQVGMGDAVFAPLYTVLKRRGVQFEFFHSVDSLELSPDGENIDRIRLTRQVELNVPEYCPLIDVNGLPVWPATPCFDQLERGAELKACWNEYNLESPGSTWPYTTPVVLERSSNFDLVVLGISLGALGTICQELTAKFPKWKAMLDKVCTTPTLACQLWFEKPMKDLGWSPPAKIVTDYAQRLNTIADMSHLLPAENWTGEYRPEAIAYFCGPLAEQDNDVKSISISWLQENAAYLFPSGRSSWRNVRFRF
jgi:uncharacterized protein with NAD-binding domain and iron-sulfur cluster